MSQSLSELKEDVLADNLACISSVGSDTLKVSSFLELQGFDTVERFSNPLVTFPLIVVKYRFIPGVY